MIFLKSFLKLSSQSIQYRSKIWLNHETSGLKISGELRTQGKILNLLRQFSARQIEKTSLFVIFTGFTINFLLNPGLFLPGASYIFPRKEGNSLES